MRMWKTILKIFGILYLPLLMLSLILFFFQKKEHINYYSHLQKRETQIKKSLFLDLFHTPIHNGNYWANLEYPADFDPLHKDEAFMKPYIAIIKGLTDYDQFRFIDLKGQEFFRVERKGTDSLEIGGLQDKHKRPYFKKGVTLTEGQLYLSPINLNREYGEIEKPFKPVLRVVGPIFDINNKKIGIFVINFKMEKILDLLRSNIVDNNFYLLNDSLNIITTNTFKNHIPYELSKSVSSLDKTSGLSDELFKKDTTILSNHHIYTIYPINLNEPKQLSAFGSNAPLKIVTSSNWVVVHELPSSFMYATLRPLYLGVGILNLFAIIVLMSLAYFFVKNRVEREMYFNELETNNGLLLESNQKISNMNQRITTRNKQLSEFNYLVSHNLKAPVSSLSVIVKMIKKENELEKVNELMPSLVQISESITELAKDMGNYVSILNEKELKIEQVDIELLIDKVKNEFSEIILYPNDFEVYVDLKAWKQIEFSRFYLQSVVQNLISNAIKYRRKDVASFIKFRTAVENDKKALYITDNGIGINLKKHGDNIFKLYKRFHRQTSGKGIGLFLVKSQLESLEATITIESEENAGSTLKILFN